MVYDRSLTNRSRRTGYFSRVEFSNLPAESVCHYYLSPVCRLHFLKQLIRSRRYGDIFIYFLLGSICPSGPRPTHWNVPAAGFRDKQTEKGTPVFFVSDSALPSRIARGRGDRRDAARDPKRARRRCLAKMSRSVLIPLRRRRSRGPAGTRPCAAFERDVSIRNKKSRSRWITGAADGRLRGARDPRAARYAIALIRDDRRESLRAAVFRFITPTRALR